MDALIIAVAGQACAWHVPRQALARTPVPGAAWAPARRPPGARLARRAGGGGLEIHLWIAEQFGMASFRVGHAAFVVSRDICQWGK